MTGPTHREYSVAFVFLTSMLLYYNNILSVQLNSRYPNYYLALLIMIPIAKSGAKFPDVDHEWDYVKDKTLVNKVINIAIHATGGKHRSWQTHSIDIVAILTASAIMLPDLMIKKGIVSELNSRVFYIVTLAFMSGWVSHIFSDMLNGTGVRVFCWSHLRVAFVPHKFMWIRFNTGESWERFNYFLVSRINILLGIISIAYPFASSNIHTMIANMI